MQFNLEQIIGSQLFKKTAQGTFGYQNLEIIRRPSCFFIRPKKEDSKLIRRMILFPPKGSTANKPNLLNPHPEARSAKVLILGKINPIKKGFKPLAKDIKFNFSLQRAIPTESNSPYAKFSIKYCGSQLKSWKNWFYVVKENGWGNFHSLINLSEEWVLAILEKTLIDQKEINITPYLEKLIEEQSKDLRAYLNQTVLLGDKIFDDQTFVKNVLKFPPQILIPVLIRMLNTRETGRHEPCTFFALLLKIAITNKSLVMQELERAIKFDKAPYYYLDDLKRKLRKN